ncbi:pentapeptide repeat-containing protein [Lentzea sp. NPDC058436]|uniref:pentapeptide repeat-containing protein n=1 Tax=Lentzea sp. NPDC058436 TaxID=3346499 RepID=UPI00365EB913
MGVGHGKLYGTAYSTVSGDLADVRFPQLAGEPGVSLDGAVVQRVDFSAMRFARFTAHDSALSECDFTGTVFDDVSLGATTGLTETPWDRRNWPRTTYRDCVFRRTRFARHTYFGNARFERCLFDGARLRDVVFTQEAEFVDCVFRGPISRVNFWGRPGEHEAALGRDRNEFTGNDFTGATLEWVAFNHVDLRAQRLPGAPSYALLDDVSRRVDAVLTAVATWPDADHREEAAFSLGLLAEQAARYNDDLRLVRRDGPELGRTLPVELRQELFDLLRSRG